MQDLNISTATKNNWERLGKVAENDADIRSRLTKRANKQYSLKNIIPVEYFADSDNYVFLSKILDYLKERNLVIRDVIFNIALNLLNKHNLAVFSDNGYRVSNLYLMDICRNLTAK